MLIKMSSTIWLNINIRKFFVNLSLLTAFGQTNYSIVFLFSDRAQVNISERSSSGDYHPAATPPSLQQRTRVG